MDVLLTKRDAVRGSAVHTQVRPLLLGTSCVGLKRQELGPDLVFTFWIVIWLMGNTCTRTLHSLSQGNWKSWLP